MQSIKEQSDELKYNPHFQKNQPGIDPTLAQAISMFTKAVTEAKARTVIAFIPYIEPKYQTVRGLAKILGVSRQTVHNWLKSYAYEKIKGGENA